MCWEDRDNVFFCLYRSAVLIGSRAIDLVGFELGGGRNGAAISICSY